MEKGDIDEEFYSDDEAEEREKHSKQNNPFGEEKKMEIRPNGKIKWGKNLSRTGWKLRLTEKG